MSMTKEQIVDLVENGQISIAPFSAGFVVGNGYRIQIDNSVTDLGYYSSSEMEPEVKYYTIGGAGFYLNQNHTYVIKSRTSIDPKEYQVTLVLDSEFAGKGISINDWHFEDGKIVMTVTSNKIVPILQNDIIARLVFEGSDNSPMVIPVGGIIGWYRGEMPYGYEVCDGTKGTPDLSHIPSGAMTYIMRTK